MDKDIQEIRKRLDRLEGAVFTNKVKSKPASDGPKDFSGAKGGVLYLISKGYFDQQRLAPDTKVELGKNGYHYVIQVVQNTLNRLAKAKGPLVALTDKGRRMYVKRK